MNQKQGRPRSNSAVAISGTQPARTRHKSGNASYADLITRAILSSKEKRLALSEIYDWMVDNVPGLKDQRYLHSAKGWKNAVRHTLSINPRFVKIARLGRPGWWTLDDEYQRMASASPTAGSTASPYATAFILDGVPGSFRARLGSAPALVLSQFLNGTTPGSRSPQSASISRCSSPLASPMADLSLCSPNANNNASNNAELQTVQVWQDPSGLGSLAVPNPLPMRIASVSETGTQTECLLPPPDVQRRNWPDDECLLDELRCPPPEMTAFQTPEEHSSPKAQYAYSFGNRPRSEVNNGHCRSQKHPGYDERTLPDDLVGIDVDPTVSCDVLAVLQYEQSIGRTQHVRG